MSAALRIWQALDAAWTARDPMPTMRELVATCGLSSTSVALYHLDALARAGVITRAPGKARAIRLQKPYPREEGK